MRKHYMSQNEKDALSARVHRFAQQVMRLADRKRVHPDAYLNGLMLLLGAEFARHNGDDFAKSLLRVITDHCAAHVGGELKLIESMPDPDPGAHVN